MIFFFSFPPAFPFLLSWFFFAALFFFFAHPYLKKKKRKQMRMKPPRIRMRVHVCVCTRRQELKKGKTKKEEGSFSTREERHRLCDNVSKERCTMVFFFSPPPSLLSPHSLSRVSVFFFFLCPISYGFLFFFFFLTLAYSFILSCPVFLFRRFARTYI